jgi:polyisoprenoid-binding protein YceI
MKTLQSTAIIAIWLLNLAACSPGEPTHTATASEPAPVKTAAAPAPAAPDVSKLPAGAYKLDPLHASLIFRVSHLGFSNYTGQFRSFTADMTLDPAQPEKASLTATVDLKSLDVPTSPADFIAELLTDKWLGASITPQMAYVSTSITKTGPATADIAGNLTLKGVTKPVTLHATFNGGYDDHPFEHAARIGFSAHGTLKRSEFGIDNGIPAPGSSMGVFDDVTIEIEAEFTGPASKEASLAQP